MCAVPLVCDVCNEFQRDNSGKRCKLISNRPRTYPREVYVQIHTNCTGGNTHMLPRTHICVHTCLFIYLPTYLFIHSFSYLSSYLFIYLATCLSIYISIYTCLSFYLATCLSFYLVTCLSLYLATYPSIYLFIYLSLCVCLCVVCECVTGCLY